jgi:hypothetical protein
MAFKKGQVNETVSEVSQDQEEVKEQKVTVLTDWKQLKEKNAETTVVNLEYPDGSIIGVEIRGLSKAQMNALNEKYEGMREAKPKVFFKETKKWVAALEDSKEYMDWDRKNKALDNLKACEVLILALVKKPEGNTLEEQMAFLNEVFKDGQLNTLILEVYKFSGHDLSDKIEQAKNS